MRWIDIKSEYPDQFILLENIEEEQLSPSTFRVLSGSVIKASANLKDILRLYQEYKTIGKNVLYALPNTPEDFIIEDVPMMGVFQ